MILSCTPDGMTNTFETNIGVKQGCILSPTFFSLYINDLIDHFGPDCEPLRIGFTQASNSFMCIGILLLLEYRHLRMQNIALQAFSDK
jgi:hypothetical protein